MTRGHFEGAALKDLNLGQGRSVSTLTDEPRSTLTYEPREIFMLEAVTLKALIKKSTQRSIAQILYQQTKKSNGDFVGLALIDLCIQARGHDWYDRGRIYLDLSLANIEQSTRQLPRQSPNKDLARRRFGLSKRFIKCMHALCSTSETWERFFGVYNRGSFS